MRAFMTIMMVCISVGAFANAPAIEAPYIVAPKFVLGYQGDSFKAPVELKGPPTTNTRWTIKNAATPAPQLSLDTNSTASKNEVSGELLVPTTLAFTALSNGKHVPLQLTYTVTATFDPVKVGNDEFTEASDDIVIEMRPFDITRYTSPSDTTPDAYKSVNLMIFLLDGKKTSDLFNSKLGDLAAGLADASNARGIQSAANAGLMEQKDALSIVNLLENVANKDPNNARNKKLREFYDLNQRAANTVLFSHLDLLPQYGLVLPFLTAHIDKDSLGKKKPVPNAAFVDKYLRNVVDGGVGDLTELDIFRHPARKYGKTVRDTMKEAKEKGVFLAKKDPSKPVALAEGDGTKDNSKVCGQIWNGSAWVDTCILCTDPARQSFCAIVEGECTLASDAGPCDAWPEAYY